MKKYYLICFFFFLFITCITSLAQNNCASKSLRFNDDDHAFLSKIPAITGNQKTWTFSAWIKIGNISNGNFEPIFGTGTGNASVNCMLLYYGAVSNEIGLYINSTYVLRAYAQFRDPSAWQHIVLVVNTTEPNPNDRNRLYVNGVELTDFELRNNLSLNTDYPVNNTIQHGVGGPGAGAYYFDGYMSDIYFVDGQALTPSSFGQVDPLSGGWQSIPYTGTYGTNGFYLNFSDNAPAADLGRDISGNNNTWNINNLDSIDQMMDVPANNFCTLLPINTVNGFTFTDGNLQAASSNSAQGGSVASFGVNSGKWYWEVTFTGGDPLVANYGAVRTDADIYSNTPSSSVFNSLLYYRGFDGAKQNGAAATAYGSTFGINDVIGVALDMNAGTLEYFKNGVSQGIAFSGLSGTYFPTIFDYGGAVGATSRVCFGQGGQNGLTYYPAPDGFFRYPPPAGFKALNAKNTPIPSILKGEDYFSPVLYTGNTGINSYSSLNFQPGLVILKDRSAINDWGWFDAVRGTSKYISCNTTLPEVTNVNSLTGFNSNGVTLGNALPFNSNSDNYVAYNWKTDNTSGIINSNGSISSTASINTISGVSIVKYTGTGINATVGHGLSTAPQMIIVKNRTSASDWVWYHNQINAVPENGYTLLNANGGFVTDNTCWNNTDPTSATFSIGTNSNVNTNGNEYVAYLFNEVEGFSKIGSYVGNGSNDGSFVWCGFKPKFVLYKRVDVSGNDPFIQDGTRSYYNSVKKILYNDWDYAEVAGGGGSDELDFLSNGFKWYSSNSATNASGGKYIFIAFAEIPFKYASGGLAGCSCAPNYTSLIACDSALVNGNWYFNSQSVTDTLTAQGGCDSIVITALTVYPPILLSLSSKTNVSCNGGNNGSATIIANGGTPPFHYTWLPSGDTGASATGLIANTYTVSVTDSSLCDTAQLIVIINEPPPLTAFISDSVNVSCYGDSNGLAIVSANGGTSPYSYSWSSSATTITADSLTVGGYTVTVTDSNNCTQIATVIISQPDTLSAHAIAVNIISCNGGNNGSAHVVVTGGVSPYTYSWSSGGTDTTVINLQSTTYTVTVIDNNSCIATDTIHISEPAALSVVISSATNVSCNNGADGSATVNVNGGIAPYLYSWNNGTTAISANSLSAGTYIVTVTDSNNCVSTDSAVIAEPLAINSSVTIIPAICTSNNGGATAITAGGIAPYTYSWSNGETSITVDSLIAGSYTLTVTDSNLCTQTQTIVVNSTNPLTLDITTIATDCDTSNGQATLTVQNGTPPYTYTWVTVPVQTTQTASGLGSGSYQVTVSDSNGCVQSQTATITTVPNPTVTITATSTTLQLGGSTQLIASGGQIYSWTSATELSCVNCANPIASPTQTITYCVKARNNSGCEDSTCIVITVDIPCGKIEIPTAFSPNNDGYNDLFLLQGLGTCVSGFSFVIFDRWGEKVYESVNANSMTGWDGTYNGKPMNAAVFVYYLNASLISGETVTKKGNISLIR